MSHTARLRRLIAPDPGAPARGICSICSIQPYVIEAGIAQAQADGSLLLIESTCNQVNQFGGYSGLTPADFRARVQAVASAMGFPLDRLILGGDHLGPYPFRGEPAAAAMGKACEMVRAYAQAGVAKLHLDPSMPLGGEGPLDPDAIAARCAQLCAAAEEAAGAPGGRGRAAGAAQPLYVIGTDVPTPGGSDEVESGVHVTTPQELEQTLAAMREAFLARGLARGWERVIAVVVQPGVEHGDHTILEYQRSRAAPLCQALRRHPPLVFEGHTTDYQTPRALAEMVEDGIAILKVGPSLTGALREAVFLLAQIEEALAHRHAREAASDIVQALERAMRANPVHWQGHYSGEEGEVAFARKYSLLDRIRYYWAVPGVESALRRLLANLRAAPIPLALLSQYFPAQYGRVRDGTLAADPEAIIRDRIRDVLRPYWRAVGDAPPE